MGSGPQVEKAERQQKHIALSEAIRRLEDVSKNAQYLLDDINGAEKPPDKTSEPIQSAPSFLSVLNSAPNIIHGFCDEANKILSEIREALF